MLTITETDFLAFWRAINATHTAAGFPDIPAGEAHRRWAAAMQPIARAQSAARRAA